MPSLQRPRRMAGAAALATGLALAAGPLAAQDRADLERTQITGNKELPKVLYIVPWKKPISEETRPGAAASVLDEVLAPVDRDVFRRQLRYDAQSAAPIQAAGEAASPAPAR